MRFPLIFVCRTQQLNNELRESLKEFFMSRVLIIVGEMPQILSEAGEVNPGTLKICILSVWCCASDV